MSSGVPLSLGSHPSPLSPLCLRSGHRHFPKGFSLPFLGSCLSVGLVRGGVACLGAGLAACRGCWDSGLYLSRSSPVVVAGTRALSIVLSWLVAGTRAIIYLGTVVLSWLPGLGLYRCSPVVVAGTWAITYRCGPVVVGCWDSSHYLSWCSHLNTNLGSRLSLGLTPILGAQRLRTHTSFLLASRGISTYL